MSEYERICDSMRTREQVIDVVEGTGTCVAWYKSHDDNDDAAQYE